MLYYGCCAVTGFCFAATGISESTVYSLQRMSNIGAVCRMTYCRKVHVSFTGVLLPVYRYWRRYEYEYDYCYLDWYCSREYCTIDFTTVLLAITRIKLITVFLLVE